MPPATTPTRTKMVSWNPVVGFTRVEEMLSTTAATAASSPEIATAAMITVSAFTPRRRPSGSP